MIIHVPRSKVTSGLMLQLFEQELSAGDGRIVAPSPFEIDQQTVNNEKRSVSGIASVESISRTNALFRIKGMHIEDYNEKNPVVLVCHNQESVGLMPGAIATIDKVTKRGGTLAFRNMVFDDDLISDAWWQKVRKGIVRMTSIGAFPLEWEIAEEEVGSGKNKKIVRFIDITESELGEISICAVGANRGAYLGNPVRGNQVAVEARLGELEAQIARLQAVATGRDIGDSLTTQAYGDASFPDAAFIVEKGAPKQGGKTVHKYRHLPHHVTTVKSPTDNSSVDVPHLRNALARVNQVKPVGESADSYRARAKAHLEAHARALLKSRKEEVADLEVLLDKGDQIEQALGMAVNALGEFGNVMLATE